MLSFKMDYTKLCKEILDLDPKIRFAGVCDESGEIKFGGQREGLDNLLTAEETKGQICRHLPDGAYAILYLLKSEKENMLWQNMRR